VSHTAPASASASSGSRSRSSARTASTSRGGPRRSARSCFSDERAARARLACARLSGARMSLPAHAGADVRTRYLNVDGAGAILTLLHRPRAERARAKAVMFCPPFGWEELCSYRRRRDWAQTLAGDCYPTLTADLPGTGDSAGSPFDADRLRAWRDAICASAEWLRATTGARAVTGVGIGLGGLLLCDALGAGADIDELVLWAAPGRGASFVRELR